MEIIFFKSTLLRYFLALAFTGVVLMQGLCAQQT